MCFVKSKPIDVTATSEPQPIVQRSEADASLTKASRNENVRGINQNIKTSPLGLEDEANVERKKLLGE